MTQLRRQEQCGFDFAPEWPGGLHKRPILRRGLDPEIRHRQPGAYEEAYPRYTEGQRPKEQMTQCVAMRRRTGEWPGWREALRGMLLTVEIVQRESEVRACPCSADPQGGGRRTSLRRRGRRPAGRNSGRIQYLEGKVNLISGRTTGALEFDRGTQVAIETWPRIILL